MAMIFHKTKQQKLQSLSHAECRKGRQSEFGTPKMSNRTNACVAQSARALSERKDERMRRMKLRRREKCRRVVKQRELRCEKDGNAENSREHRAERVLRVMEVRFCELGRRYARRPRSTAAAAA
jgi:hypothetical protein